MIDGRFTIREHRADAWHVATLELDTRVIRVAGPDAKENHLEVRKYLGFGTLTSVHIANLSPKCFSVPPPPMKWSEDDEAILRELRDEQAYVSDVVDHVGQQVDEALRSEITTIDGETSFGEDEVTPRYGVRLGSPA